LLLPGGTSSLLSAALRTQSQRPAPLCPGRRASSPPSSPLLSHDGLPSLPLLIPCRPHYLSPKLRGRSARPLQRHPRSPRSSLELLLVGPQPLAHGLDWSRAAPNLLRPKPRAPLPSWSVARGAAAMLADTDHRRSSVPVASPCPPPPLRPARARRRRPRRVRKAGRVGDLGAELVGHGGGALEG
jgi:hypothetical protein